MSYTPDYEFPSADTIATMDQMRAATELLAVQVAINTAHAALRDATADYTPLFIAAEEGKERVRQIKRKLAALRDLKSTLHAVIRTP